MSSNILKETYIEELITQIRERAGSFVSKPDLYGLTAARIKSYHKGISISQWRSGMVRYQAELTAIEFPSLWTIAGEHLPLAHLGLFPSEDCLKKNKDNRLTEDEWDLDKELREIQPNWGWMKNSNHYSIGNPSADDLKGGAFGWSGSNKPDAFWGLGWIENHSIRDYDLLVLTGYSGLRQRLKGELEKIDISSPEYPQKIDFLRSAMNICDAGITLGRRYAEEAARKAAETQDAEERQRLQTMASICERVPEYGAQTFREAVQALWFGHLIACAEDGINANSLGRIDQILFPYYSADLNSGEITREEAVNIMAEFACKLYLDYDVQTITLGGQDEDGNDVVNELSYIILEATEQVGFIRALNIRLHDKSPQEFVEQAAALILRGGGIPYIFNDNSFISAMTKRGIELKDARNYAVIGCVELTIPGKANPHAVSGWFNALKCLELTLNGGVDMLSGEQILPASPTLAEMTSFEELKSNYQNTMKKLARRMVYCCNVGELHQQQYGPLPGLSLLTDDCISRARDITDGGALYNYHSVCFLGAPDTADALCALKKLVFEQGKIEGGDLFEALRNNYEGAESLRRMLINEAPKYGNDVAEVDDIAGELCREFIGFMDEMSSPLGGRFYVHLFSFLCNIDFGRMTAATPDGRKNGEPVAYSLSAHQGRDIKGVTAMINSLARLPHDKAAGGSAAIIDISPNLFEGESGPARLAALIRAAFAQGVGQLQFNFTTLEQMLKAKEDPDNYGNLQVRVAGYSQMFKLLSVPLQDHVISRTKHEH